MQCLCVIITGCEGKRNLNQGWELRAGPSLQSFCISPATAVHTFHLHQHIILKLTVTVLP